MFKPDYNNIVDVACNRKPARIPLYEHNVSPEIIEKIIKSPVCKYFQEEKGLDKYFEKYCDFFLDYGYDVVTFEVCVTEILPFGGALAHPRPGYIDNREKFDSYPWN